MIAPRQLAAAGIAVLAAATLAGCSQAAALAPVGGNHLSEVRFATIDVLTSAGTAILTAPSCTSADGAVTCSGQTVTGDTITSVSAAADSTIVTVTVGSTQLYSGSIQDVLNDAARSTS